MESGHPTATLRALRSLANLRVADVRASGDALAWFELLALARAVEIERRLDEREPILPPAPPAPPRSKE